MSVDTVIRTNMRYVGSQSVVGIAYAPRQDVHVIGGTFRLGDDPEDGYTSAQISVAIESSSSIIGTRAEAAKAAGMIGAEATLAMMEAALNAEA